MIRKVKILFDNNMTISEFIEFLKIKGKRILTEESNVLGLPDNKYIERYIVLYEDKYWLIFSVYDNYMDKCYYFDFEEYKRQHEAEKAYLNLTRLSKM